VPFVTQGSVPGLDVASDGSIDTDGVLALVDLDALADAGRETISHLADAVRASGRVTVAIARAPVRSAHAPVVAACTLAIGDGQQQARADLVRVADCDAELATIRRTVAAAPRASATLAGLLRVTELLPVAQGLTAESLAYSTLLAGPEFAAWLRARPTGRPEPEASDERVLVAREGDRLTLTLARPAKANAYDRAMRDALADALSLAVTDDSIARIELRALGHHFCAGGDLAEFGTTPDPVTAHLVRTTRSVGMLLHGLAGRTEAHLHGACVGAGIELAAFAGRVHAAPDTVCSLPELSLGLVPGAGGTVSLSRRIGRWRTAYLALTGAGVDAETARDWGLVDAID
jgi:hypothetical protein